MVLRLADGTFECRALGTNQEEEALLVNGPAHVNKEALIVGDYIVSCIYCAFETCAFAEKNKASWNR